MNLSIIIPAYNESLYIYQTIKDINIFFSIKNISYEIIIVSDGSTDKTEHIIKKIAKDMSNVIPIHYKKNRGKGFAVKIGIEKARGEDILFMDADHSVNIREYLKFKKYNEDILIASIENNEVSINDKSKKWRKVLRKISKVIPRYVLSIQVKDTQRGFKLFKKVHKDMILEKMTEDGFGFDMELLVIAQENNLTIKEIFVDWDNPQRNNIHLKHYIDVLKSISRIFWKKNNNFYKSYIDDKFLLM